DAEAPFGRLGEGAVVPGEREVGLDLRRAVSGAEPEVLVELEAGEHRTRSLAGVHHPVGIPDPLERRERVDDLRRVHAAEQLRPGLAVAVLAGDRPAV